MRTENEVGLAMPPIENDVPCIGGLQIEVIEKRRHLPDGGHNPPVGGFTIGLQRAKYRREVARVGLEPAVAPPVARIRRRSVK